MIRKYPLTIYRQLTTNTTLLRVIKNSGWLLVDQGVTAIVAFAIGLWVARYLGPTQYGIYNYGYSIARILGVIALLGLDNIIVRDLTAQPNERFSVLGSAFALRSIAAIIAVAAMILFASIFHSAEPEIRNFIFALTILVILKPFETIQSWFRSELQSKYSVIARLIATFYMTVARIGMVLIAAPLMLFGVVLSGYSVVNATALTALYRNKGGRFTNWKIERSRLSHLLRDGFPLLVSALASIIYLRSDQIMLQRFTGNEAVGLYAASVRIADLWKMLPFAITTSVLPVISATRTRSHRAYERQLALTFQALLLPAIVIMTVGLFTAPFIIKLLYGTTYMGAETILSVLFLAIVPMAIGSASTLWLIAENLTGIVLQRTLVGAVVNVVLNFFLIPKYGGLGAAVATLTTFVGVNIVWQLLDPRMRTISIIQLRSFDYRQYFRVGMKNLFS